MSKDYKNTRINLKVDTPTKRGREAFGLKNASSSACCESCKFSVWDYDNEYCPLLVDFLKRYHISFKLEKKNYVVQNSASVESYFVCPRWQPCASHVHDLVNYVLTSTRRNLYY